MVHTEERNSLLMGGSATSEEETQVRCARVTSRSTPDRAAWTNTRGFFVLSVARDGMPPHTAMDGCTPSRPLVGFAYVSFLFAVADRPPPPKPDPHPKPQQGLLNDAHAHHSGRKPFMSVGAYVATVATVGLVAFGALVSVDGGAYSEHLNLRLSREGAARVTSQRPPRGFEGWKGAPLWDDVGEIPVLFTKGADEADFVVVGHSTDLSKDKYFLASLHKHGIHAALSGNGTRWHWFEDKLMGAKAALLQMSGNPVVMFADTTDVMFSCPDTEILARFAKTGADILIGGESQLWPEIDTYFDMTDEREFLLKTATKMGEKNIGLVDEAADATDGEDRFPNKWANGGTWMGRRNDLLDYFSEIEGYLTTNVESQGVGDGFARACKPYKMTNTEYEKRTIAAGFFDDQTCLNRFLMESAWQRNSRVKVDMDGSLMLSLGGTDPNTFKTAKDGRVFWEKTQKAPCVWHFNNPDSKKRMPAVAKKFPGYWV